MDVLAAAQALGHNLRSSRQLSDSSPRKECEMQCVFNGCRGESRMSARHGAKADVLHGEKQNDHLNVAKNNFCVAYILYIHCYRFVKKAYAA